MSDDKDRDEDVVSTRQYIQSLRRLQSNRVEPAPASAVADADSLISGGFSARNRMRDSARTSSNESSPEKMKTLGRWDRLDEGDGGEEMDQETAEKHLFGSIAKRHDPMSVPVPWGLVHPLSTFMRRWDMLTMWLLLYTAIWTPFEVAFVEEKRLSPMYFVNMVINLAFFTDMILNFNLMYFDEKLLKMISDRKLIAKRYLRGFFIIDFISILPYDDITLATGSKANLKILRIVRIVRLAKLLRILRSSRIFARFENSMTINYGALKLVKFVVGTLFIAHWMACLWHLVKVVEQSRCNWVTDYYFGECLYNDADNNDEHVTARSLYFTALYLSTMTISTVGYGDVTPQTEPERVFLTVGMLVGASVYAYIVGSICSVIASMNYRETEFQELMDRLNLFIKEAKIDTDLAGRLRAFFRYRRKVTNQISWGELLDLMSPSMRQEVATQINTAWLIKVEIFHGIPEQVAIELSFNFVLETFPPEEHIIGERDESTKLFVLKSGVVMCKGRVRTIGDNACFGEDMLWRTMQRGYKAVSLTFCDCFTLKKDTMERVMDNFPSVRVMLRKIIVRKIVQEKIVETSRIVKEFKRFMKAHKELNGPTSWPPVGESMDFLTNALGFRFRATVSAKLMIMRNSDPQYYRKINSLAMYMQRMFRGHQGRQMAVLRKMAQSKNMPVSLLSLKSVREQMLGERERLMKFKESETHSPAHSSTSKKHHEWDDDDGLIGEPKKKVHLTPELNELREQLLESVGSIVEETVRRELGKAGVGRSQPTRVASQSAPAAHGESPAEPAPEPPGKLDKKKSSTKKR
ncbi:voltage-gated ion channel superfamily [Micromonas commoda]|jgi:hypothetical protein|uniref:Voltage-gated ion channel superfamily n=1 Tax=Micromonas commoda (strain RCC299 / NOUM17 / CCMP2709) TaxID=296587 RepID=C1DYN1_MICCC|nr:voltage-gated ion channel superfamily [Micromonas commoda]ACO61458.1 voltage-gated ion channel superfamily [Micromonas commoda]|eukprot:XP_002500200.1 voltage-gated ion channel superfamily [Micromonas commoda]